MKWKIVLTVDTTQDEVERLSAQVERVLCPDPDHEGACPVPWEIDTYESDEPNESLELQLKGESENRGVEGGGSDQR